MKTRRWIVITILALALGLPVSLVSAASSASITIHVGYHYDNLEAPSLSSSVNGTVLRQGTPAHPNPGGGTLACTMVGSAFTDPSGKFEFSLIDPLSDTYIIGAGYPGYLSSETTVTIPPSRDVGTTTLCGGDVNADRVINILDIGTIIGKFGSAGVPVRSDLSDPPVFPADCTDPDESTDINDDGNVNISDLAIAAGNLGLTGPTRWDITQCDL